MSDFIEILVVLAIFALSALAGGRKQRQERNRAHTQTRGPRPWPAPARRERPVQRPGRPLDQTARPAGMEPGRAPAAERTMADELFELLRDRARDIDSGEVIEFPARILTGEEIGAEEASREGSWQEEISREEISLEEFPEVASLETLEPAGGASHVRFHEKYVTGGEGRVPQATKPRKVIRPPGTLREAVVWSEILGQPKGMTR